MLEWKEKTYTIDKFAVMHVIMQDLSWKQIQFKIKVSITIHKYILERINAHLFCDDDANKRIFFRAWIHNVYYSHLDKWVLCEFKFTLRGEQIFEYLCWQGRQARTRAKMIYFLHHNFFIVFHGACKSIINKYFSLIHQKSLIFTFYI